MCWECCCDANKLAKKKKEKRKKKLIEERRKAGVNVHTCTPHNITLISELAHRQSDANQKKKTPKQVCHLVPHQITILYARITLTTITFTFTVSIEGVFFFYERS